MKGETMYQTDDARWDAVVHRDTTAAGAFVYGVVTTGIYCRPGCPSRLPNVENVRFFDTWDSAERAGFRPCKRCTPRSSDEPDPALAAVERACRIIEAAESVPTLAELAAAVGFSPYHFQRLFKRTVGVSPRQYAARIREERARASLQTAPTVTQAIYDAGFGSSTTFYESTASSLGMGTSAYRTGGEDVSIHYALARCDLGWVLVAVTEQGVCRIDLDDTPEVLEKRLRREYPRADLSMGGTELEDVITEVVGFLDVPERGLSLPLDIQGTAFQRQVWAALREIQPGSTVTYGEIAARLGKPRAARAVAGACAANRIAVAIPCHRVVRGDGELGGYRWGLERKRALIDREARDPTS
jgi:AraC family transcriptional regulator of adaptative response/methylated-DNA-[protein]-cysteine methyltransferase